MAYWERKKILETGEAGFLGSHVVERGIGYNQRYQATLFYDNAIMGIRLMEAARQEGGGYYLRVC